MWHNSKPISAAIEVSQIFLASFQLQKSVTFFSVMWLLFSSLHLARSFHFHNFWKSEKSEIKITVFEPIIKELMIIVGRQNSNSKTIEFFGLRYFSLSFKQMWNDPEKNRKMVLWAGAVCTACRGHVSYFSHRKKNGGPKSAITCTTNWPLIIAQGQLSCLQLWKALPRRSHG